MRIDPVGAQHLARALRATCGVTEQKTGVQIICVNGMRIQDGLRRLDEDVGNASVERPMRRKLLRP